ncbi:hypothetical protein LINGRAHAP2_LOCUS7303, partial [Linum grandiflorum]
VVYNLTPGFFTEAVGRTLGNFVGRFVKYDPIQYYDGHKAVMRIRTELDITLPLKREKRIRRPGEQPRVGAGYLIEEGMAGNNPAQQQWNNPSDVPKATSSMAAIIASEQRSYEITGERKRRFQETAGSCSEDGADVMICSPTKRLSPAKPTTMQIPDPGQIKSTACKLLQFNP